MSNHQSFIPMTYKHYSNKETNRLTREALCTALVLLIRERPFTKITITDLVQRAGVSRTAYYSNYSSKEEILIDLVDSLIFEINQCLLPYTDENTGKAKEPETFIHKLFQLLLKRRDIYQTLIDANFSYIILDRLNDSMISSLLDQSDETMYQIYFNAGALYNVFTKWIQSGCSKTVKEMTQICLTIYNTPMSQK